MCMGWGSWVSVFITCPWRASGRRWHERFTDELLEQFAVVGPYEEVGAKIAERYDGLIQEMSLEVGGGSHV